MEAAYAGEETMTLNLGDIPDLTGIQGDTTDFEPFVDGWYEGTIVGKREFTDKNGNDRVFESADVVSQKGDSRNIRLQVLLKRQSDKREMNLSTVINYVPDDLTQETIQQVAAQREKVKAGEEWGTLFRAFMAMTRLGKLQTIAGVRQLQRGTDGALNLAPLFGKTAYFKLKEDSRNPLYKEVADFRHDKPKKAAVL